MTEYNLYCTPEQTRKGLELGAPIKIFGNEYMTRDLVKRAKEEGQIEVIEKEMNRVDHATVIGDLIFCIPTAEQIMQWLESKGIKISIMYGYDECGRWSYDIDGEMYMDLQPIGTYTSRKEATNAAIEETLNYLMNH